MSLLTPPDDSRSASTDAGDQRARPPHRHLQPEAAAESTAERVPTCGGAKSDPHSKPFWQKNAFWPTLAGGILLWAALPPLGWWPLAWLAPFPWAWLIALPQLPGRRNTCSGTSGGASQAQQTKQSGQSGYGQPDNGRGPGRLVRLMLLHRPYGQVYWAGYLFWLATFYWLTLPHWAGIFGWLALAWYIAIYFPGFIGAARLLTHRWHVPVPLAAAIAWTACEYARGHVLGGFTMASLGHTQYPWVTVIQAADTLGAYGIGFLLMLAGATLATAFANPLQPRAAAATSPPGSSIDSPNPAEHGTGHRGGVLAGCCRNVLWGRVAAAGAVVAAMWAYGYVRLQQTSEQPGEKVRVALIQGCFDTTFAPDPGRSSRIYERYLELSQQALERYGDVDLVVWPETMFGPVYFTFAPDAAPPPGLSVEEFHTERDRFEAGQQALLKYTLRQLAVPLLAGVNVDHFGPEGRQDYNAAMLFNQQGELVDRYDKMHPVIFGEYMPLGDYFPWLYEFSPMVDGLAAGEGPQAIQIGSLTFAPSICFESLLPQLIRRHVVELTAGGEEPDVLVNVTNDGWFYGSSELDLHLICGVFRAVECRKPMLIAANTGFSAWIDQHGRILARGPRHAEGDILAEVGSHRGQSLYVQYGDWLAASCLLVALAALVAAASAAAVGARRGRQPQAG